MYQVVIPTKCTNCGAIDKHKDVSNTDKHQYYWLTTHTRVCGECGHKKVIGTYFSTFGENPTQVTVPPPPEYDEF